MFELKNYTFIDDFSMLICRDVSSRHIFFITGKFFPRVLICKKGIAYLKNDKKYIKIIGFKFSLFSLSKNTITLNPKRLKHKQNNAIEVNFSNALTNRDHTSGINKVSLDYIRSNFPSITYRASQRIQKSFPRNYSWSIQYVKLKTRLIQISHDRQ